MMHGMVRLLLLIAFLFGIAESAEAQFLNRLKKRIVDETERIIIDKTAEKAAEKTGDAMDKILSPDLGGMNIFEGVGGLMDIDLLPQEYHFDYLYSLNIINSSGDLRFDYFFNKTEPYLGLKPSLGNDLTMVIDEKNKAIVTLAEGQVFAMEMSETTDDISIDDDDLELLKSYKVTELPNRSFLGYDCAGYRMENDEFSYVIYVSPNMEVGFGNVFNTKQTNIPSQLRLFSKYYEDGLLMYMEMTDKKKKGKDDDESLAMECVAFEKKDMKVQVR